MISIKVIQSLGLQAVSSEGRSAKPSSMEEINAKEVRSSNIYIGIFYRNYSLPTIKEFNIAKENMISQLVFIKDSNDEPQEDELNNFIKKIRSYEGGLVTESFKNIRYYRYLYNLMLTMRNNMSIFRSSPLIISTKGEFN